MEHNLRETSLDPVMANTIIVDHVCILHERDPFLGSENEHHSILATTGIRTPGFQGGSPLCIVHEPEGDIVVVGHLAIVTGNVEEGKYGEGRSAKFLVL